MAEEQHHDPIPGDGYLAQALHVRKPVMAQRRPRADMPFVSRLPHLPLMSRLEGITRRARNRLASAHDSLAPLLLRFEGVIDRVRMLWASASHPLLIAARVLWVIVAAVAIWLDLIGLPQHFGQLLQGHYAPSDPLAVFGLTKQETSELATLGLSQALYVNCVIVLEVFFVFVFVAVAAVILRQGRGWKDWFFSLTFLLFGTSVTGLVQPLKVSATSTSTNYIPWHGLAIMYETAATICALIFFYVVPTGQFIPKGKRLWVALCVLWVGLNVFSPVITNYETFKQQLPWSFAIAVLFFAAGTAQQGIRLALYSDRTQRLQMIVLMSCLLAALLSGALFYLWPFPQLQDLRAKTPLSLTFKLSTIALTTVLMTLVPVTISTRVLGYQLRIWKFDIGTPLRKLLWTIVAGLVPWLIISTGTFIAAAYFLHGWLVAPIVFSIGATIATLVLQNWLWQSSPSRPAIARFLGLEHVDRARLRQLSRILNKMTELSPLIRMLATRATQLADSRSGIVYLAGSDGQFRATFNLPADAAPALNLHGRDIKALEQGRALRRSADREVALILPLIGLRRDHRSSVEGLLVLGPHRTNEEYTEADCEALLSLAREAGLAISGVQLLESYRDREAFRSTARGRADIYAQRLAADPSAALLVAHHLAEQADSDPDARALLRNLPQALADLDADASLIDLAQAFSYLTALAPQEEISLALRLLTSDAITSAAATWTGGREATPFYVGARRALGVESLRDIVQLLPSLDSPPAHQEPSPPAPSPTIVSSGALVALPSPAADAPTWVAATRALSALRTVAVEVDAALSARGAQEQEDDLTEALHELERFEREIMLECSAPERLILGRVAQHWRALCAAALADLPGGTSLDVVLVTRRVVVAQDNAALALELINRGSEPAMNVGAELLPSREYAIIEGVGRLEEPLEPGWSAPVSFRARPLRDGRFHPRFRVRYDDEAGRERQAFPATAPVEILAAPDFVPFVNPYIAGRSLSAASPVFVGRAQLIESLVEDMRRPGVVVLTGEHRMGKTSLLKQLPVRIKDTYAAVLVDCQMLVDPGLPNFFYNVACEIAQALELPLPSRAAFQEHPGIVFERELLPAALASIGERRLLLMVDEYEELERRAESGKLDADIFPFLRHLMQHQERVAFVFVGTHQLEELKAEYWSSFFNVALHRRVGLLEDAEADELMTQPVQGHLIYDDLAIRRMLLLTAGHPYFLQLFCQILVNQARQERRTYLLHDHVQAALPRVLQSGVTHLDSLWKERSLEERLVLFGMSQIAPVNGRVTEDRVLAYWAEHGVRPEPRAMSAALDGLCSADILASAGAGARDPDRRAYQWKVRIIGHWVQQAQSLSRVLSELTEREHGNEAGF